jgi:hypothetical protein
MRSTLRALAAGERCAGALSAGGMRRASSAADCSLSIFTRGAGHFQRPVALGLYRRQAFGLAQSFRHYLIVRGHHMKDGFDSDEFVAVLAR